MTTRLPGRSRTLSHRARRGNALVAALLLMAILNLIVLGLVVGGTRDQDLSARSVETIRAFYAAEAGANMAIRELMVDADEDGDGTIGSISDDGNNANDPQLGPAQFRAEATVVGSDVSIDVEGRDGAAIRSIDLQYEKSAGGNCSSDRTNSAAGVAERCGGGGRG